MQRMAERGKRETQGGERKQEFASNRVGLVGLVEKIVGADGG